MVLRGGSPLACSGPGADQLRVAYTVQFPAGAKASEVGVVGACWWWRMLNGLDDGDDASAPGPACCLASAPLAFAGSHARTLC